MDGILSTAWKQTWTENKPLRGERQQPFMVFTNEVEISPIIVCDCLLDKKDKQKKTKTNKNGTIDELEQKQKLRITFIMFMVSCNKNKW